MDKAHETIKRQWCSLLHNTLSHHRSRYPHDPRTDWELMTATMTRLADHGIVDRRGDGKFVVGRLVIRRAGGRA
jgi:hypothetical protein